MKILTTREAPPNNSKPKQRLKMFSKGHKKRHILVKKRKNKKQCHGNSFIVILGSITHKRNNSFSLSNRNSRFLLNPLRLPLLLSCLDLSFSPFRAQRIRIVFYSFNFQILMGIFTQIFLQPPRQPLAQSTFLGKESVGMFNAAQSSFSPFNEDLMRFVVIPQFIKMYTMCEVRESVQSTCAEANFNVLQGALLFIRLASEWEHITDRWLLCKSGATKSRRNLCKFIKQKHFYSHFSQ